MRAEVGFATETSRRNLRIIPSPKSERVRRTWIPTTSLVTSFSALAFVQRPPANSFAGLRRVARLVQRQASDSPRAPPSISVTNSSAFLSSFLLFASFVILRRSLPFSSRKQAVQPAIPDVSKRWLPNNKTNNIQRRPGISTTAYSL
jgi:hypothetical protein